MKAPSRLLLLFFLLSCWLGCKDDTLGPDRLGTIEGIVLEATERVPLAGVSITTSPPTSAVVTGADGAFALEAEQGNYTINARRPGYGTNVVTVSVAEGETTDAALLLEAGADTLQAQFAAEIATWSTRLSNDSAFVLVEYRAQNPGPLAIGAYEVYFRIETENRTFFWEAPGQHLAPGQADVGRFERYTLSEPALEVAVDSFWTGQAPPAEPES